MEILIDRAFKKADYTISHLLINGKRFCETVEDADRGLTSKTPVDKIKEVKSRYPGMTAIPSGTYRLTITYSPKFKKKLILVNDVPGFSGIRIHAGNTAKDSLGCVLPGRNTIKGGVTESRVWTEKVQKIVQDRLDHKEECWLRVL